ncbi:MAG: phosphoribosyltransferase [Acetobacteraceae bacterium]
MPALRVVTLAREDFDRACGDLLRLVARSYAPTMLVGIRTGGLVVAEAMARTTPAPPPVMPLTCRRAGTQAKARVPLLGRALSALPRPMADGLRKAEFNLTAGRRRTRNPPQAPDEAEAAAIAARTFANTERLLVVDDAVDSGVTLAAVLTTLRRRCAPATLIRSAVITQTLENPVIAPDYALHRSVLCRFPWSFDAAA